MLQIGSKRIGINLNNIPVASIGTLGVKSKNTKTKTNLTSPDIITLHKNLEKLKKQKIDNVIIEASSHGLEQKRLEIRKSIVKVPND